MRAFDALNIPNANQRRDLAAIGFECWMGYTRVLGSLDVRDWLGLGGAFIPLTEQGYPTSLAYFTPAQGRADGLAFVAWADAVGMPRGVPYVGTFLDFDCPASAMEGGILPYVNEQLVAVNARNPMWMYGSRDPLDYAITTWPGVAGAFQAYAPAWSQGRNATPSPLADVVQVRNSQTVYGLTCDLDMVTSAARLWRA